MEGLSGPAVRRRMRLPNYDYAAAGAYFITICTHQRQLLFSNSVGADLRVGPFVPRATPPADSIPLYWLLELERKYSGVRIDSYAIMPDHVHFILVVPGGHTGPPLQEMMKWYKTQTTNAYIQAVKVGSAAPFLKQLWQRSYYDHIIRSDTDLSQARQYIEENPIKRRSPL